MTSEMSRSAQKELLFFFFCLYRSMQTLKKKFLPTSISYISIMKDLLALLLLCLFLSLLHKPLFLSSHYHYCYHGIWLLWLFDYLDYYFFNGCSLGCTANNQNRQALTVYLSTELSRMTSEITSLLVSAAGHNEQRQLSKRQEHNTVRKTV